MNKIFTLIFCLLTLIVRGQSGFTRNISIPVTDGSPLDLAWSGGLNYPLISEIDFNDDNVPDLFIFDRSNNRVLTFINNGGTGTNCWEYAPQYADNFPKMHGWAFLYDYNCDNKPDLMTVNNHNNGIAQYRNDSHNGIVAFTQVDSTINYAGCCPAGFFNIIGSENLEPNFNDIDGDGDMDILGQQFQCVGGFAYYKNMSMEHTGHCDSLNDYVLDTYLWGEFALRSGVDTTIAVQSWNVSCFGGNNNGSYEVATRDDTYANIFTIDIDGDGDKDALIGDSNTFNSLLVYNGGSASHATMVSQDTLYPSYDIPVNIHAFAAHAYVDVDNDQVKDLIVTQSEYQNKNGVYFYKNIGTNAVPHFNQTLKNLFQNEMIDVGECSAPVFFDYDNDGLKDLVIGNKMETVTNYSYVAGLTLYKNIGTSTNPSFQFIGDDYAGLRSMNLTGQLFPAFGDVDGDNDMDMIIGQDNGQLIYFTNTAGPGAPAVFANPVAGYRAIDVGQAATPQLIDLNRDGHVDLVIGGKNGLIKYFQNTGSSSSPFNSIPTNDTLGGVIVQSINSPDGFSTPFIFEQAGDYRMLVSCMKGDIYLYGNIDGNLTGNFTLLNTVFTKIGGNRYGYNLNVSGGDINNDTLVDMLIGFYGGGPQIYYQDNLTNIVSSQDKSDLINLYPNPASDNLIVKTSFASSDIKCSLVDITGRLILSQPLSGNYSVLNVSKVAEGTYFLRINSGEINISKKIIIER